MASQVRTNWSTNPSFETSTTLSSQGAGIAALDRIGGPGSGLDTASGDYRLRVTGTTPAGAGGSAFLAFLCDGTLVAGQWVAFAVKANRFTAGTTVALGLQFRTGTTQVGTTPNTIFTLPAGSLRNDNALVYVVGQVPAGADNARAILRFVTNTGPGSLLPAPDGFQANLDADIFGVADSEMGARLAAGIMTRRTTSGTPFSVLSSTIPGHDQATLAVPNSPTGPVPLLVFCHGSGGGFDQFTTASVWQPMRDWLIDNGWGWVEGTGAPTPAAGENGWGNAAARAAYLAYIAWAKTQVDAGPLVVLGRSMGGIVAHWLAGRSPIAGEVAGLIANAAVSTMFVGDGPGAGTSVSRSSAAYFSNLGDAFGVPYGSTPDWYQQLQVAAADYAPENWAPSTWTGKKILHLYGTTDTSVPWYPRGGSRLREIWAGRPAIDRVAYNGGDHGASGPYLLVPEMTEFLTEVGGAPGTDVSMPLYFDGSTPNTSQWSFAWTGAAHASTSVARRILTAELVDSGSPRPVQLVIAGLPAGVDYTLVGQTTDGQTWPVPGGTGTTTGQQIVLVDNRAPLNADVTYVLTAGGVTYYSNEVTVASTQRAIIQSLDGQTVVEFVWRDNGLPNEPTVYGTAFEVPGRERPPVRFAAGGAGGGSLEIRTDRENTARLHTLLRAGRPVVVRTDGAVRDFPAVEILWITAAGNALFGAFDPRTRQMGTDRVWSLPYLLVDDPEPGTPLAAFTWADFDAAWAGKTWADFDAFYTGQTWDQFDRQDYGDLIA
jgi:hypothetical protein